MTEEAASVLLPINLRLKLRFWSNVFLWSSP